MEHVLAIDAGTTGVTALVMDADRNIVSRAYQEFTQHYPEPGRVEHDAVEIHKTALAVGRQAVQDAGASQVVIGITNQRETIVAWDEEQPLAPAIVWQDRRTADWCRKNRRWEKVTKQRTGLVMDPYFSGSKMKWLIDHVPGVQRAENDGRLHWGTIDSWLLWKLTGLHATDVTNASRTNCYDIHKSDWDPELCSLFGVDPATLPQVYPSGHDYAETDDFGVPGTIKALVGDQQASLFGHGCFTKGQTKNTYGTGCFLMMHTGADPVASKNGLLTTRAATLDTAPRYALEGSVFVGGAAVQWLRDALGIIQTAPEVNDLAAHEDEGVVVVPAFAGLGAPHWDPQARGAILGLTRGTGKEAIARATLEAIAFQCTDVLEAMEKDAKARVDELAVDGGAAQSPLLLQFQADQLQRPVHRATQVEMTGIGAGLLAGLRAGIYEPGAARPAREASVHPRTSAKDAKARRKRWSRAVKAVRAFGA